MFIATQYLQNLLEFGSDERVNFYFSQMAYVNVLLAYAINSIVNTKITHIFLGYVVGDMINEVVFKGDLSYIEIIIGALALIYYFYKRWKTTKK